jgi:hypothetical protein
MRTFAQMGFLPATCEVFGMDARTDLSQLDAVYEYGKLSRP